MVSIRNYFTIVILMLMVFVMFMFVGVSSNILSDTTTNNHVNDKVQIDYDNTITADSLNLDLISSNISGSGREILDSDKKLHVAILSEDIGDVNSQLLIEWCVYSKHMYKVFNVWPDVMDLSNFDVILFGSYTITSENTKLLYEYADLEIIMIFTQLPGYQVISSDSNLAAFFGIGKAVMDNITADGIKIFSNFMMSRERIYSEGDYFGNEDDTAINVPYYNLRAGYEVYAVGILDDQEIMGIEDRELPPLLWRTYTGKSLVCAVNSDIFEGMTLLGVLTGFMTGLGECYIYPIVNAQTISMINYPYLSNENNDTMEKLYSRSSEAVSRDILWPNIIQVLKNYGDSYSFFMSPQLNYHDNIGPSENYLDFYMREINKLPGSIGLSLGQVSDSSIDNIVEQNQLYFRRNIPEYDYTALYAASFNKEEIIEALEHRFLKDISLVMSDYNKGDNLISYLNGEVLSVKFNLDGARHETMDDLQMISIENALGMSNMKMDVGPVFYPKDNSEQWNNMSITWSKGKTYYEDFSKFDMVNIYEMENRVRRFLALDFNYKCDNNTININIDYFEEEAYFMVYTDYKTIVSVDNGVANKIKDNTYLIKANDDNVRIYVTQDHLLEKPGNNRIITKYPE